MIPYREFTLVITRDDNLRIHSFSSRPHEILLGGRRSEMCDIPLKWGLRQSCVRQGGVESTKFNVAYFVDDSTRTMCDGKQYSH